MFKDNKLRLLMTLVGFSRLGDAHDPDATWVVPSSLTSAELQEAIDLLHKYEMDPPTYEDGKGPEDLLRSRASAARRSARRVDFDDDDDGIDNDPEENDGEFAHNEPTVRKPDWQRKKFKRRQRSGTPEELDDEEKERRAELRRKRERERLAKTYKSAEYIQDSSDDDADNDAAFFAREEELRQNITKAFKTSLAPDTLLLGSSKPSASKKRKADGDTLKGQRRKTPPKRKAGPFADSDDETDEEMGDAASVSSVAKDASGNGSEDEATDTPLSSQHANGIHENDGEMLSNATKNQDVAMADIDGDEDEEDVPVVRRPMARNTRAGFIVDSDSE